MERSQHPPIAMVSRLRVEVRGETMEACEAVAFQALDHARMAGVMEGYVPTMGEYTDHFFHQPQVVRKPGEPAQPWDELGLPYAGRLAFVFEPMAAYGGLKQFGYRVEVDDDPNLPPMMNEDGYIVLSRQRPVTREHTWEVSPLRESADESGESIIDDIRTIHDVLAAEASIDKQGANVTVWVRGRPLGTPEVEVREEGESLREAAAAARKRVIEVLDMRRTEDDRDLSEPMR